MPPPLSPDETIMDADKHHDGIDLVSHSRSSKHAPTEQKAPVASSIHESLSERRGQSITHRPISPLPLRRSPNDATTNTSSTVVEPAPAKTLRLSVHTSFSKDDSVQPSLPRPSSGTAKTPQRSTPSSSRHAHRGQQTPKVQTPISAWSVDKIEQSLRAFAEDVKRDHSRLVCYTLQSIFEQKPRERRHLSSIDDLRDKSVTPVTERGVETMKIRSKQHGNKGRHDPKQISIYPVCCIKTNKKSVPKYNFHHVEISRNILTPNTMLKFVPHLRDLEQETEEKAYQTWLSELEAMDSKSGFKTLNRNEKVAKTLQDERAATLSLYLERWIAKLGIENCTKSTLIRHMASQPERDDAITPQQKSSILNSYSHSENVGSPRAVRVAKAFFDSFDRVFKAESRQGKAVGLREVLLLDESVENIVDAKKAVKDVSSSQRPGDEDQFELVENWLQSYSILGCLICHSHSCEHGEYDAENQKRTFSSDSVGRLRDLLRRGCVESPRDAKYTGSPNKALGPACKNQCFRSYDVGNPNASVRDWTTGETMLLRSLFAALGKRTNTMPQCIAAMLLGRKCWEVYRKLRDLHLKLPTVEPPAPVKVKPLNWYDRHKKCLFGDWQNETWSHEHARREIFDPCNHDGPCNRDCPCVQNNLLCERFCRCTVENCAYKFTGCACHSSGKTCLAKQKEGKPCICIQLNRECDPVLCKGCGAKERADPQNAHDEALHATGCQNCSLQRGVAKTVLLGQSQLPGVGYGLFTAEDIAQDDFVIEYIGELITHDEGVRREARRGNVFDEASNSSYLFTLLEQEGIWVDAATYGNLSRYINHAPGGDRLCNVTPKILYVNGEFRIRFTSLRDIHAGEELFFNYGEYFPNLTSKLIDDRMEKSSAAGDPVEPKRKDRRQREQDATTVARKSTSNKRNGQGRGGRKPRGARKEAPEPESLDWLPDESGKTDNSRAFAESVDDGLDDEDEMDVDTDLRAQRGRSRKRKRVVLDEGGDDDDEEEEYRPEINDSQEDGEPLAPQTAPARRPGRRGRQPAKRRAEASDSDGEVAVTSTPTRRRRGPAPGKRRKNRQAVEESEAESLPPARSTPRQGSGRRRRQAEAAAGITAFEGGDGEGITVVEGHAYGDAYRFAVADDNEDEDEDVVDSSRRRKRQPPLRYREDE